VGYGIGVTVAEM